MTTADSYTLARLIKNQGLGRVLLALSDIAREQEVFHLSLDDKESAAEWSKAEEQLILWSRKVRCWRLPPFQGT